MSRTIYPIMHHDWTSEGDKLFNKLKLRQLSEQPLDCNGCSRELLVIRAQHHNLTPAKLSTYESNT